MMISVRIQHGLPSKRNLIYPFLCRDRKEARQVFGIQNQIKWRTDFGHIAWIMDGGWSFLWTNSLYLSTLPYSLGGGWQCSLNQHLILIHTAIQAEWLTVFSQPTRYTYPHCHTGWVIDSVLSTNSLNLSTLPYSLSDWQCSLNQLLKLIHIAIQPEWLTVFSQPTP